MGLGLLICDIPKKYQYVICYSWKSRESSIKIGTLIISHEIYDSRPSIFLGSYLLAYFLPSDQLLGYILYLLRERYKILKWYLFQILRDTQKESDRLELFSRRLKEDISLVFRWIRPEYIQYQSHGFIFELLSYCILVLSREVLRYSENLEQKIITCLVYGQSVMHSHISWKDENDKNPPKRISHLKI